jgi:hypothetical protein
MDDIAETLIQGLNVDFIKEMAQRFHDDPEFEKQCRERYELAKQKYETFKNRKRE